MLDADLDFGCKRMYIIPAYTERICIPYEVSDHIVSDRDRRAIAAVVRRRAADAARTIDATRPFELYLYDTKTERDKDHVVTRHRAYYTVHFLAQAVIDED